MWWKGLYVCDPLHCCHFSYLWTSCHAYFMLLERVVFYTAGGYLRCVCMIMCIAYDDVSTPSICVVAKQFFFFYLQGNHSLVCKTLWIYSYHAVMTGNNNLTLSKKLRCKLSKLVCFGFGFLGNVEYRWQRIYALV